MKEGILDRMGKEAVWELLHYHDRNIRQRGKDVLKRAAGRYVPPEDGIFWDTGLLANGLMGLWTRGKGGDGILDAVRQYFDRWIGKGMPVYYVDDALCGVALLQLYGATSDARYRAGADRLADYLLGLGGKEADAAGSIPYRPAQGNGHVYVDGIGMMCPFLAMYGAECGNDEAVVLALAQVENMLKYGMDERTGLPYHGFRYENRVKYGIIGWGRSVGWLLMGMGGILYRLRGVMESAGTRYRGVEAAFGKLLEAARPFQRADGGFPWQLEAAEGPADSSATAMIARAAALALELGCGTPGEAAAWETVLCQAAGFLAGQEKDGRVYGCLGECMGFAQYPQVYGAYPWSLGTALEVVEVVESRERRRNSPGTA